LFKNPCIFVTDYHSSPEDLHDTAVLLNFVTKKDQLKYYLDLIPIIKEKLGFVNCAVLNQVGRECFSRGIDATIQNFKERVLSIFQRDCGEYLPSHSNIVQEMSQLLNGVAVLKHSSWSFLVEKKGGLFFFKDRIFVGYLSMHISFGKRNEACWVDCIDDELTTLDAFYWIQPIIPIYQAILDDRWEFEKFENFASNSFQPNKSIDLRTSLSAYKAGAENNIHTSDLMYIRVIAFHDHHLDLKNLQIIATLCKKYYGDGDLGKLQNFWDKCYEFIIPTFTEPLEKRQKYKKGVADTLKRLDA